MVVANIDQKEQTANRITLVIPSPGNAIKLQKFIFWVREKFQARILHMVGSQKEIIITLQSPVPLTNLLDELQKMPKVRQAEEKETTKTGLVKRFLVSLDSKSEIDD